MHIEIVTHCYRYATLLRFQLSSLVLWPPCLKITVTVWHCSDDADTVAALEWFGCQTVPNVVWNWQQLVPSEIWPRSIGRNRSALSTHADWVWFTDADYWFTRECWEWFVQNSGVDETLIFPRIVMGQRFHALGDACIQRARKTAGIVQVDKSEFEANQMKKSVGGIQIVRGDVCRARGYLKMHQRAQQPASPPGWSRTRDDVWFRRDVGTPGTGFDIPGVYRIRHSQTGRDVPGLVL